MHPDGRLIAFVRSHPTADNPNLSENRLVLLDPVEHAVAPLTTDAEITGRLRWLDDQTLLVEGGPAVWTVKLRATIEAASTADNRAGRCAKCRDGAVTNSAYPAAWRGNQGIPNTASPTANRVTPTPTASTVPATSQPTVNGGGPITAAIPWPARVFQSTGLTPAAATRTRISVGSGSGTSA